MWFFHCPPRSLKFKISETALSQRKMLNSLVLREELVARGLGSGLSVLRPWSLRKWGREQGRGSGYRRFSTPQQVGSWTPAQFPFSFQFYRAVVSSWCVFRIQKEVGIRIVASFCRKTLSQYRKAASAQKRFIICQRKVEFKKILLSKTLWIIKVLWVGGLASCSS